MKTIRSTLWLSCFLCCVYLKAQVWSPDGNQLAFFYIHEIEDIYLVNKDGSAFEILDKHPDRDFMPAWSPDGEDIIFTSTRDRNHQIYRINLEEGVARRLIESNHEDTDGHYDPIGNRIVFSSNRGGNSDLYLYEIETAKTTTLTKTPHYEYTPRWSPDGSRILYKRADDEFGASDLYALDVHSLITEKITMGNRGEFHQNWSIDGKNICYVLVNDGTFELQIMNLETREKNVLVKKEGFQVFYPNWSPDGKYIAFTRDVSDGQHEDYPGLYVVDMRGDERLITNKNSFELKNRED